MQGFLVPSDGQGDIRIDNLSLQNIPRSILRRRIIALPQTPFFLPDGHTIRDNLNMQLDNNMNDRSKLFDELELEVDATAGSGYHPPSPCREQEQEQDDEGCDDVMEYALRAVDLWDDLVVSQGAAGFGSPLREEALSRGQRQMFSLARAIMRARARLRRRRENETGDGGASGSSVPPGAGAGAGPGTGGGGILLLDEYNAGLDADTDRAMWAVILREFQGYTIVCVAHQLLFITECYVKVVVMGDGRVIEVGSPDELLDKKNSKLRELWGTGTDRRREDGTGLITCK